MSDFFSKTGSDTFRSVLIYGKDQESRKKCVITVQKNFVFLRGLDRRNTFLQISKKSYSKSLFSNYTKCKTVTRGQLMKDKN